MRLRTSVLLAPAPLAILGISYGAKDALEAAVGRSSVREAFTGAGHAVLYLEVPEGHNAATWRNHAGEILEALFPPR